MGEGGGKEPNHTTAGKPGPLEIIQNSLGPFPSLFPNDQFSPIYISLSFNKTIALPFHLCYAVTGMLSPSGVMTAFSFHLVIKVTHTL